MTLLQAVILGIIQGVTEFAPISSSAHLVIMPRLLNWPGSSVAFAVMLHLGTLVAVIFFFWRDIVQLVAAFGATLKRRSVKGDPLGKLSWLIVIGTIPAAIIAFLFKGFFENLFKEPVVAAYLLLVTGLILWLSERLIQARLQSSSTKKQEKTLKELNLIDSLIVGFAQALAIAPGISRSGITIAAGLWRSFSREEAARYSFLLAIPIIFGAAVEEGRNLSFASGSKIVLIFGFLAAVLSGHYSIKYLLKYLRQGKLNIFAYYCWIVGIGFIMWEMVGK